ncbi:hypothetical protein ED312_08680 [Sinomicrobium pectinilyticum]|uniref:Uncharacterized protein n=1 Tax=Sinomicrobium pectinilyticum TaxID=1084421 RepID=A0A3N0EKS9_SINP1|nr:hypothetical protein [Sinomicrobium pectinilyticum]RNL88513.1 hypothetical protein ED312_08680 [Sinomicrobium pectinilyticum]
MKNNRNKITVLQSQWISEIKRFFQLQETRSELIDELLHDCKEGKGTQALLQALAENEKINRKYLQQVKEVLYQL